MFLFHRTYCYGKLQEALQASHCIHKLLPLSQYAGYSLILDRQLNYHDNITAIRCYRSALFTSSDSMVQVE